MNYLKNKRGMSISIVLLVIATLVLSSFALVSFHTRQKSLQANLYSPAFLQDVYAQEAKINFYAGEVLEKIDVKGLSIDDFKNKFNIELGKYKEESWEFIIKDASIEKGKATITLEVKIKGDAKDKDGKELYSVVYIYTKIFEKPLI